MSRTPLDAISPGVVVRNGELDPRAVAAAMSAILLALKALQQAVLDIQGTLSPIIQGGTIKIGDLTVFIQTNTPPLMPEGALGLWVYNATPGAPQLAFNAGGMTKWTAFAGRPQ